jgi:DNA-binding CsgD family transcriptional regulator
MIAIPASTFPAKVQIVGRDPDLTNAIARLMSLDGGLSVAARTATAAPVGTIRPDVLLYADDPAGVAATLDHTRIASPGTVVCVLDALRDLTVSQFLEAVRAMAPAAPRHLQPVPAAPPGSATRDMRALLSDRELEVVRLVAEGLSNKEISSRLSLSDKTVKNHISHILAKLNLTARTQVAVMALRAGIAR